MRISDLLQKQQRSLFVGREEQLVLLTNTLSSPDWQLLSIYGPGGIGKTTLLRIFAQTIDPVRCFYLDGYSDFRSANDFLSKLRKELLSYILSPPETYDGGNSSDSVNPDQTADIDLLNWHALQQQGIVLILDTFEQCGAIESWLRNHFLYQLNPLVKVVIAGRYALKGQWQRGDWNLHVRNVELKSLSHSEIVKYAMKRGIMTRDMTEDLARFSKGMPLALSMACEIIVRNGNTTFLDQFEQHQMIGHLAMELTQDIDDAALKQYIEAASVLWKFDQELLQTVVQERIPTERFREFCTLPFVIRHENSWSLHDSVRQWIYADFQNRMPQKFQLFRKQALSAIRKRELEYPDKKAEYAFEKVYLSEDDFIRNLCFQWDDSLTFRPCTGQELEQVERLYLKYLHNQSNYIKDESHLESLIRPLWNIDPSAFAGLWNEKQLVAFCACIPLNEQTVQIFRSHPITAPATKIYDADQHQCLVCIAGVEPLFELEISGSVARALIKIIDRDAFIVDLISMPHWIAYLPILGFKRASWADSVTQQGVEYKGFQMDLRNEGIPSLVDRIISSLEPAVTDEPRNSISVESGLRLSLEEATKLVQCALKQYSSLPMQPNIGNTLRPLLTDKNLAVTSESIAYHIQRMIQEIVQSLSSGTKEEKRLHQILHYAYIQKIGTHETVAEYLNISIPSYYRYLRTAVRRLTYELIKEDRQRPVQ